MASEANKDIGGNGGRGPGAGEGATDDSAWENDLTEEDMPSPEQREETAHDLRLDPDVDGVAEPN
jgi:hypothetical protein